MTGKILVIDDDPHILYLLRIILKTEGFAVLTCQDEREAFGMIKKEHPNLVILDILMPRMSGWEICKAIRGDSQTEKIPILIISSLPFKDKERVQARELDVYDYIAKPFEPIHLLAKVKNLFSVPQPLRHLVKESPQKPEVRRGVTTQKVEVLVVGGGMAGLAAAETCARSGANVMLVEQWPFLGGEMVGFHQLAWPVEEHHHEEEKFFHLLKKDKATRYSARLKANILDPEGARKAAYMLLKEYQVPFILNAHLLDVLREGTSVKGAVIEGESGAVRIEARILVDTTPEGIALDLAGIPASHQNIEPASHFLLGGVDGEALEKSETDFSIYPLPSMREALLCNVQIGLDWKPYFYEGIDELMDRIKKTVPGCENIYLLQRPFWVLTRKKTVNTEPYPVYGSLIPKTFDNLLVAGGPLLETDEGLKTLGFLHNFGKTAGALAGVAVALNQNARELPAEAVQEALKAEGVLG